MEIIHLNNKQPDPCSTETKPSVFTAGFFDGMHVGHQKVINEAKKMADKKGLPLACITFFPHPKEILKNSNEQFQYINPIAEKQIALEKLGVDKLYIVEFNYEFASLTPKQFVQDYLLVLGAEYVVAGFDFTYGRRGQGNMERMREDADQKLEAIKVERVERNGEKVSSTLLREMICSGNIEKVHDYLDQHYEVEGEILFDHFDTVVDVKDHYLIPCSGLYDVSVSTGREEWQQRVIVDQERMKIILSRDSPRSIKHSTKISIKWLKQVSTEFVLELAQSV
ncbi:FAD synthetase family protein [Salicibibacter kimchii]|uniref:FAD synthase n=1 Tax=Salicibibacter kimchii TaxID=2099786 RepID=A0A345C1X9_9BACI|nr:FAD synthetase family protein [Salicibibacter kimchii]AXF57210.1 FAD synthetase [Salicibibacter kimchii]